MSIRILFLADTHLGYDLPMRPRIQRRRRGYDFIANFEAVLDAAVERQVHCVLHGGDLFFRSRVPREVVHEAFRRMRRVAAADIPIFLVPGNHERSHIPYPMMVRHPNIHIFDRPSTYVVHVGKTRLALAGFPFCSGNLRRDFPALIEQTGWRHKAANVNLLCVHHSFEGATVGPGEFVFRYGKDVARLGDVPPAFAAVLSGHIHRHQALTSDLHGRKIPAPVLYPGSIERTSYAEKDETKGYLLLDINADDSGRPGIAWEFAPLPARPMLVVDLPARDSADVSLEKTIRQVIVRAPANAVLRLRIHGFLTETMRQEVSAGRLRQISPPTMNVEAVLVDELQQRNSYR